jgi:hypothetical protein
VDDIFRGCVAFCAQFGHVVNVNVLRSSFLNSNNIQFGSGGLFFTDNTQQHVHIADNTFASLSGAGIELDDCHECDIIGNSFIDVGDTGYNTDGVGGCFAAVNSNNALTTIGGSQVVVSGNTFINSISWCSPTATCSQSATPSQFVNTAVVWIGPRPTAGTHFDMSFTDNTIEDGRSNSFGTNCYTVALAVAPSTGNNIDGLSITGNTIEELDNSPNTVAAIYVDGSIGGTFQVTNLAVTGNVIRATKAFGIELVSVANFTVVGNSLTGLVSGIGTGIVLGTSTSNHGIIAQNVYSQMGSSTFITYPVVPTNLLVVNNSPYNPARLTSNFITGTTIAPWGSSSTVSTSTVYKVQGSAAIFEMAVQSSLTGNIIIAGPTGTVVSESPCANLAAATTLPYLNVPYGFSIQFNCNTAPSITAVDFT